MRTILIGLGTIGKSFCQLLLNRKQDLLSYYGLDPTIVAVADSKGVAINEKGIKINDIINIKEAGKSVSELSIGNKDKTAIELVEEVDAELLVEQINPDLLNPFRENPYTHSLASVSMG